MSASPIKLQKELIVKCITALSCQSETSNYYKWSTQCGYFVFNMIDETILFLERTLYNWDL